MKAFFAILLLATTGASADWRPPIDVWVFVTVTFSTGDPDIKHIVGTDKAACEEKAANVNEGTFGKGGVISAACMALTLTAEKYNAEKDRQKIRDAKSAYDKAVFEAYVNKNARERK